jgi:hypothetical protein
MKKIELGYMGFAEGIFASPGVSPEGFKQVDWDKVKDFIETNKQQLDWVEVGLAEDWGHTSGTVWDEEEGYIPRDETTVYASSRWATPSVYAEYKDGTDETFECWIEGHNPSGYFTHLNDSKTEE